MTYSKTGTLLVLVSLLAACGTQIVEFGLDAPTVTATVPADAATGVALNTSISATFSKAMDPATLTASTFTVTQGSTAVSGDVAFDEASRTATFVPAAALGNGLVYTVSLSTGATDSGGLALAASHTWTFTAVSADAAPTVTATTPAASATGVAVGVSPTATFNMAMDPATLTFLTFKLKQGATAVTGAVTVDGATHTATFNPTADLRNDLVYTATITTGARNSGNTALAADHTWTFTTASAVAPPTVTATTPLRGAANVAVGESPTATFSKAMNAATITGLTFTLKQGTTAVPGTVSHDPVTHTATFNPAADLANNLIYTARITTGAKDAQNTALAADFTWTFGTAATLAAPTVTARTPAAGATGVATDAKPTATFSKSMNATTLNSSTFTVRQGTTVVPGSVTYNAPTKTATFAPDAALGLNQDYTATITTGARDTFGVAVAADHAWTFTTVATVVPPTVTVTSPLDDAVNVAILKRPSATFSKGMNATTLTTATFT